MLVVGPHIDNLTIVDLKNRDRDMLPVPGKDPGHPDFFCN
jgi:hypothetical protein